MASCDTYSSADWYEFEEGDMQEQHRDQMKRHLENCSRCRELYADVEKLEDLLDEASLSTTADVPETTERNILDTAAKEARKRNRERRNRTPSTSGPPPSNGSFAWNEFLLGATSAAALLLLGFWLTDVRQFSPEQRTSRNQQPSVSRQNPPEKSTDTGQKIPEIPFTEPEEEEQSPSSTTSRSETNEQARPETSSSSNEKANNEKPETTDDQSGTTGKSEASGDPEEETADEDDPSPDTQEKSPVASADQDHPAGDVNGDGNVDVIDSMMITKAAMGKREADVGTMDVNGDGRVTLQDARSIMKNSLNRKVDAGQPKQKTY